MAVDAFTYMGNIVVECRKKDGAKHVTSQLVVVACSLSMLALFTILAMQESWDTVQVCRGKKEAEGEEDDVNGWITLGFALGGVAFDIACIVEFYISNKKVQSAKHVNMFSALLHVGADFLRSTSTTVMSLLILLAHVDSGCADAYTSVIIGVSILCGAAVGFFKWVRLLFSFFIKGEVTE
jgi:Co/Zn/Cd efflux system component